MVFQVLALLLSADPVVPCGAGLCVGTTPQDVTLGITVMETRGPRPDGGLAIVKPVVPGAVLDLQGIQPSGAVTRPDVIVGSSNTHTGAGSFVSFRNGPTEVFGINASGATAPSQQFGFIDAGTVLAQNVFAGFIDAGSENVAGQFSAQAGSFVAGPSGVTVANDFTVTAGNDAFFKRNVRIEGDYSFTSTANKTDCAAAVTVTAATGCTSPSVTWSNGSAAFQLDVGTSCTGVSTIGVTFPCTATDGWECSCTNTTATATRTIDHGAGTQTTLVLTNYSRTVGTAADFADGADVRCFCRGG